MERKFTVHTETEKGYIKSPFRFCEGKAHKLARNMDRLTGSRVHFVVEVTRKQGLGLIAYQDKCFCKKPKFIDTPDDTICKICGHGRSGEFLPDIEQMVERPEWYL